jgi:cyanate permease
MLVTGQWGPSLTLLGLNFISTEDPTAAVVLLTIAVGVSSAAYLGFNLNHIDLSPNYAGTMMGISSSIATIMSIIAPMLVGLIVTDEVSFLQNSHVFQTYNKIATIY